MQFHTPFRVSWDFSKGRATPARLELADAMSSPWTCRESRGQSQTTEKETQYQSNGLRAISVVKSTVDPAEDLGSSLSIHMVFHKNLELQV